MKKLILLSATTLACAVSFGAIRAVTPTQWDGKPDSWQMKRHAEKMAVVTNGGAKVVFVGDSITHFFESDGTWKKYFGEGDMKALDLGTSADRTEHVLWRLTEGKELDGFEAKIIFLMIGTNNAGHFPFDKEPPTDAILGIREILRTIVAKQPKATVVLHPIFPRGLRTDDPTRLRNDVVNKEIVKFTDGKRVLWCDFTDQILTFDGILSRDLFPDLLHPITAGYEIWYAAVRPYIDAALSNGAIPMPASRFAKFPRKGAFYTDEQVTTFGVSRISANDGLNPAWWTDRLLAKRNEIADAKGEFDLVFFGDSITHNWENQGKDSLAELRKTYRILDIGYGGDRTQHLVWRGENGELDGYKTKGVMLMIGTNNGGDKETDIADGVRKILGIIAKKQPQAKTLLLPIFPYGEAKNDRHRAKMNKVNEIIRGYADGEKVIWVDFNDKWLDEKGSTKWIMPDGLHPNADGYKNVWLPAVLPHFKKIVGK